MRIFRLEQEETYIAQPTETPGGYKAVPITVYNVIYKDEGTDRWGWTVQSVRTAIQGLTRDELLSLQEALNGVL